MNGPICFEDAKTNRLCKICEAKLKAGIITENDVKIWKELIKLAEKNRIIELEFVRSFEINGFVAIICKGNIGALIGKGGKNIKELEQKIGKKIRIVEKSNDAKQTAQSFLGNTPITAVNKVFRTEGEETKIVISKKDEKRLPQKEETEKALSKILGTKTTIEFQ
jgi:transcription antitermination factor NusA-like protein